MKRKPEDTAIIDRCEEVRRAAGLIKSRFSESLGLKAQTYSNFIGGQCSKPNVELVRGAIAVYKVSPMWLLFGEGDMFQEGAEPPGPVAAKIADDEERDRRISDLENWRATVEQVLRMIGRPVPRSQHIPDGTGTAPSVRQVG